VAPEVADWKVVVDRERCVGSGVCVVVAPDTFSHDEQAKAVVLAPAADPFEAVRTAVADCPTQALRLVTGATGEPTDQRADGADRPADGPADGPAGEPTDEQGA
jgi:ferredoxin